MIALKTVLLSVLLLGVCSGRRVAASPLTNDFAPRAGLPADIASSAYLYRADRPAAQNPPESWVLLMQYAGLPYDKPVDRRPPALRRVLCGLLGEEVRPLRRLRLHCPAGARSQPSAAELVVTCLDATDGTAHTWWNPRSLKQLVAPETSPDGLTYSYQVPVDTWGVVVALADAGDAAHWAVPKLHAYVPDRWKSMSVEVEWGYEPARAELAHHGRVEGYDGVLSGLQSLPGDRGTVVTAPHGWSSKPVGGSRRGVRFSLLYMGRSAWRRTWPYAAQQEDVARTIVTLWTRSGSFSFLAADLEHGPILAPEYGFFVRGTREPDPSEVAVQASPLPAPEETLLATRMDEMPGLPLMRGWADNVIPWFGANPTDETGLAGSLTIPAHSLAMHPLPDRDVAVGWRSPVAGAVTASARGAGGSTTTPSAFSPPRRT